MSTDYADPGSWFEANGLLEECRKSHKRCRDRDALSQKSTFKPTRLIDLGQNSDPQVRLVLSEVMSSEDASRGYIALSYCWGGANDQQTVRSNVTCRYNEGLVISEQPKSIQDAIRTARLMGSRFLWIDALCIIEDDEADVAAQMSQMDQVYQHADLLISASRAAAAVDGFLGPIEQEVVEDTELEVCLPFKYRYRGDVGRVVLEEWSDGIGSRGTDPIHKRGWTMQEHLLSKRILAFGSSGMSWQCLEDSAFGSWKRSALNDSTQSLSSESYMACRKTVLRFEDDARNLAHRGIGYVLNQETPNEEWLRLRDNYVSRGLSHPIDR